MTDLARLSSLPLLLAALFVPLDAVAQDEETKQHPLAPALRVARASRAKLDDITDYQAVFTKQEVVGGRLHEAETMLVKVREKPFSVYLRFLDPHAGREVIYVKDRNDNQILAHESGIASLVGTVAIAVDSPRAMESTRYPITMMGMRTLVDKVITQWEEESKFGEIDVKYFPNAKLGQRECRVIQTSHPQPRRQFKWHLTRLYLDKETNLPVRVEQYGFPTRAGEKPPLVESYTYSRVEVNPGFDDVDFDPKNPQYKF